MNHPQADKKIIEYPDAPSGGVYFYNYKEPLMPFENGFGYRGALIFDAVNDKIQCHFCGEWFDALQNHLAKEHSMRAAEYKERVGLNKKTALINERVRARLIESGLDKRLQNLRIQGAKSAEQKRKISATLKENRAELQNQRNTCPEQLLERFVKLHQKLGRMPLERKIGFYETLKKVYGSIKNVCEITGIEYRNPGKNLDYSHKIKFTKDYVLSELSKFYQEKGRFPKGVECESVGFYLAWKRYGKKEIIKDVLMGHGKYVKEYKVKYTKDDLLSLLRNFEKMNGRKPSCSDCRRGLLPNPSRFFYHFGSWKNSLHLAFSNPLNKTI